MSTILSFVAQSSGAAGTSASALLTPAASGITSSQQFGSRASWAASNAVADGDHCVWHGGNQVALQRASKNFVQIDLEQEHTIDKVGGLDVSNLWHSRDYNNFEHGTADIYVCRTAGSGLTAGDCSKCDGAISNTVGSYYDRACGALTGRYVRVEFLASKGLSANIHFCRLRIYGAPSPTALVITSSPTMQPTLNPTLSPTASPTLNPTASPSFAPSTSEPTKAPSAETFVVKVEGYRGDPNAAAQMLYEQGRAERVMGFKQNFMRQRDQRRKN